jgi:hypothetical protein
MFRLFQPKADGNSPEFPFTHPFISFRFHSSPSICGTLFSSYHAVSFSGDPSVFDSDQSFFTISFGLYFISLKNISYLLLLTDPRSVYRSGQQERECQVGKDFSPISFFHP